jgi:hypothetical protein
MRPNPAKKVTPNMSTTANETSPANEKSGKRLILAVVAIALLAASASWWFRYSATHRSAQFWGPQAGTLIRDAKHVTLRSDAPSTDAEGGAEADVPRDITGAKGLTHLRNALLEDANYLWDSAAKADTNWSNSLVFAAADGAEPRAVVLFSPDFKWVSNGSATDPTKAVIATTADFAAGLKRFFADEATAAKAEE